MAGGGRRREAPQAPVSAAFSGPVRHVYVHVPFCRAKCDYCDFASQPVGDAPDGALLERFVEGVAAEWERERAAHDVRRLRTLYLGGGTPSLLGPDRLERLLELFRPCLTPSAEVTVEANPEDVDDAFAAWAATAPRARGRRAARGLRVSLGVQSFSPDLRRALGRRAQADPAAAFRRLRRAGIANLSIDLIQGMPGQTAVGLEGDITEALALRPDHLSWYELGLVAGTPLAARSTDARDEDAGAAAYRRVVSALSRAGYDWYEVSSFALPGGKARHNLACWRAHPYLGLGPGAVSTVGARRWTNALDLAAWASALGAGACPPREVEVLSAATRARERLLLAARCGEPVPLVDLAAILDLDAARPLAVAGLVSLHSGTIRVTRKGRYVAGAVCVRLFRD
jgi:oxygen-independent coproporphyrinogen-3 oxidase